VRAGPADIALDGAIRMIRILVAVLAGSLIWPAAALAKETMEAVLADRTGYKGASPVKKVANDLAIELCTDSCDFFVAHKVKSEKEVWDAVFLHQAYFGASAAAKAFRAKYSALVSKVMARYAEKCRKFPQDSTRAGCIVKYLAGRNDIDYAYVRYDGGSRCEIASNLLKTGDAPDKGKCAKR
jgi:hypothetical protein